MANVVTITGGRFKSGGTVSALQLTTQETLSPRLNEEAVILWRTS